MSLDGPYGQHEPLRDLGVRASIRDQRENLGLPGVQLG